jgi:hypothetical protein
VSSARVRVREYNIPWRVVQPRSGDFSVDFSLIRS